MQHIGSPGTDRSSELVLSMKQPRSPLSVQSSPFSSTVSDNDLEGSSVSRPSSSCSSSQHNPHTLSSVQQSKLFMTTSVSASTLDKTAGAASMSDSKIFDKLGVIRSRRNGNDVDSDDETMDEDSSCSFNEISGSSLSNDICGGKRPSGTGAEVPWRSPHDSTYASGDGGRKLSFTSNSFRKTTPSPCTSGRSSPIPRVVCAAAPRSRIASIRRESNCSVETEAAHEKLMKTAQQVSATFDDISIADGERKRTHSLSEPISILTNAFLPHSCSPSPTRPAEIQKQCYSPSTQQIVRNNITYSPSPSPTPSPTRRIMRSLSPIVSRQITKRRYTCSSGLDGEPDSTIGPKRVCQASILGCSTSSGSLQGNSDRLANQSLPSGEASSTSSMESLNGVLFCTPRPPVKNSETAPEKQQKSEQLGSAMDSDECSSVTGEEFSTEHSSNATHIHLNKVGSTESLPENQKLSFSDGNMNNATGVSASDSFENGQ